MDILMIATNFMAEHLEFIIYCIWEYFDTIKGHI